VGQGDVAVSQVPAVVLPSVAQVLAAEAVRKLPVVVEVEAGVEVVAAVPGQ
jgi:hypothetical protein